MSELTEDEYCDPFSLEELARSGDREALARAMRCYGGALRAVGCACCRTTVEAEDAVQEALLSAAEHLDGYEGRGTLQAWLSRMVANACHRMRRGRKNQAGLQHTEAGPLLDARPSPERCAIQSELARRVEQVLQESDAEHVAIFAASVEGHAAPDIARKFGLEPAAVRKRISRIRKDLRERLRES